MSLILLLFKLINKYFLNFSALAANVENCIGRQKKHLHTEKLFILSSVFKRVKGFEDKNVWELPLEAKGIAFLASSDNLRTGFCSWLASEGEILELRGVVVNVFPHFYLQDSKRFEGIDADFKELAYDAQKTPNVVEATTKAGLYEKLEDIQSRWWSVSCPLL